jgi:hypothetical protein
MDCLLLNNFIFDVVFLFLVLILSRSWILRESLSGVRCFAFVLPKLSSFCFGEETLWLLTNKHSVRIVSKMIIGCFFDRSDGFVCSWAWSKTSLFLILTIWNRTLENFILSRRIELLLTHLIEIVHSRSWILSPTFVIMGIVGLLEQLPVDFGGCEIEFRVSLSNCWLLWVVSSRAHLVESVSCVCGLSQLLRWDTWSLCVWDHCKVLMLVLVILINSFIEICNIIPFYFFVVMSRIWIMLIRRSCYQSRTRRCGTKSRNLSMIND